MFKLSPVDIKASLVILKSDSVPDSATEHHLWAVHEVEHYILQHWHQSLSVHEIEEDPLICANLDSYVALDVVDEPSLVQRVVYFPVPSLQELIKGQFKKQDLRRATNDQGLPID